MANEIIKKPAVITSKLEIYLAFFIFVLNGTTNKEKVCSLCHDLWFVSQDPCQGNCNHFCDKIE